MQKKGTLVYLVNELKKLFAKNEVNPNTIWRGIRGAIDCDLLISNLAEVLRLSATETEKLLIKYGFGDLVGQKQISNKKNRKKRKNMKYYKISLEDKVDSPFKEIFSIEFSPPLNRNIELEDIQFDAISLIINSIVQTVSSDPFLDFYRCEILDYYDNFRKNEAKKIDKYIAENFKSNQLKYVVNSGIGANEQFNHFLASINNLNPKRHLTWYIIDSPRYLINIPKDANAENTLFMEFSRSGKTEETVKIHEYTPSTLKRIVFANSGPLRDLGIRDKNLIINMPDQIPGRFGRNKTPILLAVMHVAGMDTKLFWSKIQDSIDQFDLSKIDCLPLKIAQFIYLYQKTNSINHIYLGCNDDILAESADEFLQFWNEGVNKNKNDISMSRYFGLLRDSHLNIEGLLANHQTKMGFFLLHDKIDLPQFSSLIVNKIDPINPDHQGLLFGEEEWLLAEANYQRFSELMPTIKITVHGSLSFDHAAVLGQLWSDITYCYSQMVKVDPGSNPEVKYVRDRSAKLLADFAKKKRIFKNNFGV